MTNLYIPEENRNITEFEVIKNYLDERNILFEQWQADIPLAAGADQEEVLKAYHKDVDKVMKAGNYQHADVIRVSEATPDLPALRQKFLREHTHSEDEVRFFVEGSGIFWFNLTEKPVFSITCVAGDLLSVPAGTKHWFDLGECVHCAAIRIFTSKEGWVPEYTDSGIDAEYNPSYNS